MSRKCADWREHSDTAQGLRAPVHRNINASPASRMNIDDSIAEAIFRFSDEAKKRYADPEEGEIAWTLAARLADLLQQDVESFTTDNDNISWREMRSVIDSRGLGEDLDAALQAHLAFSLVPSFDDVAKRCWHLADLVSPGERNDAVAKFLARVARCYLLGLVPECLVMCRGALENAIYTRYNAEHRILPRAGNGSTSIWSYLQDAERQGWLRTVSAQRLQGEVWKRGSTAAHKDPTAVGNALGAIHLTMAALRDLNSGPDLTSP